MKTSFKVDLNKHVKGQKLAGVSTLNFHNNFSDVGWVNEVLAYRLFKDAGVPASRTAYVRLYLTVDGLYNRRYVGLYSLVENVDGNFLQARYGTREGALLKPTTIAPFSDLGDDWAAYVQPYDAKTDLSVADQALLRRDLHALPNRREGLTSGQLFAALQVLDQPLHHALGVGVVALGTQGDHAG